MVRITTSILSLVALLGLVACGGGGGGGGGGPTPGNPASLRALAIEGQPADGTTGDFAAIPSDPFMAAAAGGWLAFVAPTTDGTKTSVLYVAQPNGVLVPVFAVGDPAPDLADGTISGLQHVWMCEDGTVLVYATIAGNSNNVDFGVIASLVVGDAATDKTGVIYDETDTSTLHASFAATKLDLLDGLTALKEEDGTLWFLGSHDGSAAVHLFSVAKDGTALTLQMRIGFVFNFGGDTVETIDGFGIDPEGGHFAVAITDNFVIGHLIIYDLVSINGTIASEGEAFTSGGGIIDNIYKGGRIICGSNGSVIWMVEGSLAATDDAMLYMEESFSPQPPAVLVRTGDAAPSTGGGSLSSLNMLNAAPFARFPVFLGLTPGAQPPITRGTFAVLGFGGQLQLDTSSAIVSGGVPEPAAYVDLLQTARNYHEVSANGSFLVAMRWLSTSALFWGIREANGAVVLIAVAAQGGPTPNGDTFGSFQLSSAHTIADGVVMFRTDLGSGLTAIYAQGP